jgi:hypothetical protein
LSAALLIGNADKSYPGPAAKHDWDALALTALSLALGPDPGMSPRSAPWAVPVDTFMWGPAVVQLARAAWFNGPANVAWVTAAVAAVLENVPLARRTTVVQCIVDVLAEARNAQTKVRALL